MRIVANLAERRWPPATLENAEMVYDVQYKGRTRRMITMDYSGEVFRRVFVEDQHDSLEARDLLDHLDHAAALLLLIDPGMVYEMSKDIDAAVDDDFGMVQAVKRVRSSPGGAETPVVLVLTKMDKNLPAVHDAGGPAAFVQAHWPALARTVHHLPIFGVSVVQTARGPDGSDVPKPSSMPVNVDKPLKHCLTHIEAIEQRQRAEEMMARREEARRREEAILDVAEQRQRTFWIVILVGLAVVGLLIIAIVVVFT
jgi:hypothetical protein